MSIIIKLFTLMLAVTGVWSAALPENQVATAARTTSGDLATAETSAKLLNLFGTGAGSGYPNYGYTYNRPTNGYYPGYNTNYYGSSSSGFYPSTGYGSATYYPNQGSYGSSNYIPTQGYPQYYSNSYPTTNILGSQGGGYGGYGGYGGNGGLRQYSGYWQRDYQGQRNRGYGYYDDTDRFGLPFSRDRGYGSNSYRGYN
ncbi:shematrin-like protein 1 isoform X1 [Drosophila subpulchrella]|uniref:shematrin-like protein 1 isoform X1 n=1 Tax=Drosophila subpulchrella TaxID=1486046 RepID=UPI0018A13BEA|nr:shematrin-like protein 1 isoform X1 [Drosophila subpulchrella]